MSSDICMIGLVLLCLAKIGPARRVFPWSRHLKSTSVEAHRKADVTFFLCQTREIAAAFHPASGRLGFPMDLSNPAVVQPAVLDGCFHRVMSSGMNVTSANIQRLEAVDVEETATNVESEAEVIKQPNDILIEKMKPLRSDAATEELVYDTHYFISNEKEHHMWRESVSDLGGMMVGVGAEQNYVLAGWARPEVLVLMDFDFYIPSIHKVYGIAFEMAATPSEFIALWSDDEGRQRLKDGIVRGYACSKELHVVLNALTESTHHNRFLLPGRGLERLRAKYVELGVPCFLTDQEQYEFIANLWRRGRVLPVQGDLTGRFALADIANLSRTLDLPVRVLYMSNCESYFNRSTGNFRENIMGLPFDSSSIVLRTEKRPPPTPGAFEPICASPAQHALDFASELEREKVHEGVVKEIRFWGKKDIMDWAESTMTLLEEEPYEYKRSEIAHHRLREVKRNVQLDMHDTVEFMLEQMVLEVNFGDLHSSSLNKVWPR